MGMLNPLTVLLLVSLAVGNAGGGEGTARNGLEEIMPKWKSAWNAGDAATLYDLFHPKSSMRMRCESNPDGRKTFAKELAAITEECGQIKSYEVGKYIERKDRYVVKILYARKGRLPGTFAVRQTDTGVYLVFDFNIDGQGEPELEQ